MANLTPTPESPPATIAIAPAGELRRWRLDDVPALTALKQDNHTYLQAWLPWAAEPATTESTTAYVERSLAASAAGTDFEYGVFDGGRLVGACGLHTRRGLGVLEIGYWIAEPESGRGLGTAAARALSEAAAGVPGIDRIEICCDEANTRSAAIARALGFELSGVEIKAPNTAAGTDRHQVWTLAANRAHSTTS